MDLFEKEICRIIPFSPILLRLDDATVLQRKTVCLIPRLIESPCDVVVHFFQVEHQKVQSGANDDGIEAVRAGGDAYVEEYVFVTADGVFHDGMTAVQTVQEIHEGFPGRAFGASAQVNANQCVHAVVGDDSGHQFVMLSGGNGGHENHRVVRIMGILAAEEIDAFFIDIGFKSVSFQIFAMIALLGKWSDIVSHETTFLHCMRE